MNNIVTSKQQDKELLMDILERHYFSEWRKGLGKLEIFLFGICRANCEYCYLKKNQKQLYPTNIHNYNNIINNLEILLNWYKENNFSCAIDIFSAEWITLPVADQVFDCFYNSFKDYEKRPWAIMAADNMQFLKDDELTKKIEYQIERFNKIGIKILISASIDGKFCDYGRTINDDNFYERLKNFLKKHDYGVHPMISSCNIKDWKDNYLWWKTYLGEKELINNFSPLEVRQAEWSKNNLENLIDYYDFITDDLFKLFNYDKNKMLRYILNIPQEDEESQFQQSNKVGIGFINTDALYNMDAPSCSIKTNLTIRLGDLNIVPCHRQAYPELTIGKFIVNNNKIIDIEEKNVSLLILYKNIKRSCLPICENCKFNGICSGHCFGASYEAYRNPLIPQKNVCQMLQTKYRFLILKFFKLGLWNELPNIQSKLSEHVYNYYIDLIEDVLKEYISNEE